MNYHQTLDFLYSHFPAYHLKGPPAYKPGLKNIRQLCNLLSHPQNKFQSIHIGGTNGKGSVSHMIASILQEAGLKVGLFTSPHLKDFCERIKINGKQIPKSEVISFVKDHMTAFSRIQPSFFEIITALAFNYFAKNGVDIAVIEVGLGGRLDSTNIIKPLISVITNIGYDHIQFLGDTLEKIAIEKAGIIKQGVPVVIGETQKETKHIFIKKAKENNSPIYFADFELGIKRVNASVIYQEFKIYNKSAIRSPLSAPVIPRRGGVRSDDFDTIGNFKSPLLGDYQRKNIITIFKTIDVLRQINSALHRGKQWAGKIITKKNIIDGIFNVVKNTGIQGRWQILNKRPLTICDVAHNAEGLKQVIKQIKTLQSQSDIQNLHFIFGLSSDKDVDRILRILPKNATYYFCKANIPRALDEKILFEKALKYNLKGQPYSTVNEAYEKAKKNSGKDDLIFISGSTFVVAEIL